MERCLLSHATHENCYKEYKLPNHCMKLEFKVYDQPWVNIFLAADTDVYDVGLQLHSGNFILCLCALSTENKGNIRIRFLTNHFVSTFVENFSVTFIILPLTKTVQRLDILCTKYVEYWDVVVPEHLERRFHKNHLGHSLYIEENTYKNTCSCETLKWNLDFPRRNTD